jgi:glycerol-3-phosphate acyltransferase PlsY
MALFNNPLAYIIYAMIGWVYVTVRHTSNIKRLLAGTEPKLGDKPKQDDTKS